MRKTKGGHVNLTFGLVLNGSFQRLPYRPLSLQKRLPNRPVMHFSPHFTVRQ